MHTLFSHFFTGFILTFWSMDWIMVLYLTSLNYRHLYNCKCNELLINSICDHLKCPPPTFPFFLNWKPIVGVSVFLCVHRYMHVGLRVYLCTFALSIDTMFSTLDTVVRMLYRCISALLLFCQPDSMHSSVIHAKFKHLLKECKSMWSVPGERDKERVRERGGRGSYPSASGPWRRPTFPAWLPSSWQWIRGSSDAPCPDPGSSSAGSGWSWNVLRDGEVGVRNHAGMAQEYQSCSLIA